MFSVFEFKDSVILDLDPSQSCRYQQTPGEGGPALSTKGQVENPTPPQTGNSKLVTSTSYSHRV